MFIGQDGQATRAGGFVFPGDADGVEVVADDAHGGGGFLDLSDQADATDARVFQRGNEITPLAVFEHGIAQVARRDESRGELRDFAFLLFDNFVEDVH